MTAAVSRYFLIVVNPLASDKATACLERLTEALSIRNDRFDVWYTSANDQANQRHLAQCRDLYSDWVMIGGDGTLNLLVNALAGSNVPLGLIPCGSGNDFARNLYQKGDDPVEVAFGTHSEAMDLGRCNERYFANVLGVGFDGAVVASLYDQQPRYFRRWRYLLVAAGKIFFYREKHTCLQSSRNKQEAAFIATFANGRYFGGGMQIAPKADIHDGLLDCCWVARTSLWKKLYYLARIFYGTHLKADAVDYWQDKEFYVSTPDLPVEGDGEFFGLTPARIAVAPKAIRIKTPRSIANPS
ncbi:diacylglycerol/lipid kinase family protein [Bowmanella dokdonensis]|uniref:Diacylglycerol kinase family lipid kinase n=1 Tax=Bowmanella dokdonensis TaxID=751969 RepID=A0A939DKY2_9ALTE|nr:diacylglycerol kinase family protein [Bowmanella dokdonensis]MBN7824202.1 diacylglycerol kinase family lipid kinase [Bowmanella dokdonensis]